MPDKSRRQFAAFHKLYNFRRTNGLPIVQFISEFEHVYYEFKQQSMTLPDSVMAFMLLASCNFSHSKQQLAMSAVSDVTYENMTPTVKCIFGGGIRVTTPTPSVSVKTEPVFPVENIGKTTESSLYSQCSRGQLSFSKGGWSRGMASWSRGRNTRNNSV